MNGCLIIKLINIIGKGKFVNGLIDTPLQKVQLHIIRQNMKGVKIADEDYCERYNQAIQAANKAFIYPLTHKNEHNQ